MLSRIKSDFFRRFRWFSPQSVGNGSIEIHRFENLTIILPSIWKSGKSREVEWECMTRKGSRVQSHPHCPRIWVIRWSLHGSKQMSTQSDYFESVLWQKLTVAVPRCLLCCVHSGVPLALVWQRRKFKARLSYRKLGQIRSEKQEIVNTASCSEIRVLPWCTQLRDCCKLAIFWDVYKHFTSFRRFWQTNGRCSRVSSRENGPITWRRSLTK